MKIQYYLPDLAESLGIGEITNIFLASDPNGKVLRIEYTEKKAGAYKTIKAPGKKPAKINPQRFERATKPNNDVLHAGARYKALENGEKGFGKQVADAVVKWAQKPMRRPDEW